MGEVGDIMLRPCPMCHGRPVNNVFARLSNGPCTYCGGLGCVDTEAVCKCGRPAVIKIKDTKVCTRFECGKELLERASA